jgi:hypothetical protein
VLGLPEPGGMPYMPEVTLVVLGMVDTIANPGDGDHAATTIDNLALVFL